jgi:hypothetical protein
VVTSASFTLNGVNAQGSLAISGDASAEYQLNGGSFTKQPTPISAGNQTVVVRLTTAATASTAVKATLSIGGKTVDFTATTRADVAAPTGSIIFPPSVSLTEGNTVIMRGTVKDDASTIASVKINNQTATVNPTAGTWELKDAALTAGKQTLKLVVEDSAGNVNSSAAQVEITQGDITQAFPENGGVDFVGPQTVAWDNLDGRNRALVMDVNRDNPALVAVDLKTGIRSSLSDNNKQTTLPFVYDRDDFNAAPLLIDKDQKSAWVGQNSKAILDFAVLKIDLTSGVRSGLSSGNLRHISDLALERSETRDRLYDCSFNQGSVGFRSYILDKYTRVGGSDASHPDAVNLFDNSGSIVVDKPRRRLLMTSFSGNQFVYGIDISKDDQDDTAGARTVFSNATTPNSENPFSATGDQVLTSIRIDTDRSRALMVDRLKPGIFALILSDDKTKDGARSVLSANDKNPSNKLSDPYGLHIEAGMPYALLVDKGQKALMAVDLESGERVIISKTQTP